MTDCYSIWISGLKKHVYDSLLVELWHRTHAQSKLAEICFILPYFSDYRYGEISLHPNRVLASRKKGMLKNVECDVPSRLPCDNFCGCLVTRM